MVLDEFLMTEAILNWQFRKIKTLSVALTSEDKEQQQRTACRS
jgi:phage-related tail protein